MICKGLAQRIPLGNLAAKLQRRLRLWASMKVSLILLPQNFFRVTCSTLKLIFELETMSIDELSIETISGSWRLKLYILFQMCSVNISIF